MAPWRPEHDIVDRLVRRSRGVLDLGQLPFCKEVVQIFQRHRESIGELGPRPRLRGGFTALSASNRRWLDAHDPGKRFLAVTDDLTALRESAALGSHSSQPPY